MGTIRRKETVGVVMDLLRDSGIPQALYSMSPSGVLSMLIGTRAHTITCRPNESFYGLQSVLKNVEAAIGDLKKERDARQLDLEDCITSKGKQLEPAE